MNELSPANFRDVAATVTRTRGWGALTGNEVNLVGFGEPVRIASTAVTANVRTGSAPSCRQSSRGSRARPSWSS